jgi:hypothetical protein
MKILAAATTGLVLMSGAVAQTPTVQAAPSPGASAPMTETAPRAATGLPAVGAAQACELAVRATLRSTRGASSEIVFNAPPAALPGAAEGSDVLLRGAGRARSGGNVRTFTYSCTYDTRANSVAGVVLRDAAPAGERTAAAPQPVRSVEPDLSAVSPAACESAAATSLKRRWPNVGRIAFNADTRSLVQDSAGTAKLEGQGTAQLQLGNDLSSHFTYQCALDARTGRVLALRLVD